VKRSLIAIDRTSRLVDSILQRGQAADLVAPIISGLLLGCSAAIDRAAWLVWVGLVPVLLTIRACAGYRYLAVGSFMGGVAYSLLGCQWICTVDYGDELTFQRLREWMVLAQLCALSWPITAIAARWLWLYRRIRPEFGFCLVWLACDLVRDFAFRTVDGFGFPYLYLAQSAGVPLVVGQVGDLGGMYAITLVILAFNAMLAGAANELAAAGSLRIWDIKRCTLGRAALATLGVGGVLGYGALRLHQTAGRPGPVVTAMPSSTNWQYPSAIELRGDHQRSARPSELEMLPLVVWPEVAYPSSLFGELSLRDIDEATNSSRPDNRVLGKSKRRLVHETNLRQIRDWCEALRATLVVGCVRQDFRDGGWRQCNCALVLQPGHSQPQYYEKIALVPGTEGAPRLGGWLGYGTVPSYEAGARHPVFSVGSSRESSYRFGVAICYDICFPEIFREYFSQAACPSFFVVPGAETIDHSGQLKRVLLRMTQLRAIETRRPFVRCVHEGYSCLIDGNGRIGSMANELALSGPFRAGQVPLDDRLSLYALWGDWLPKVVLGLLLILVVWRPRQAIASARASAKEPADEMPATASPQQEAFRAGFTLVELLITIAILGVLAGLLLTAVQYARGSSRKLQCANNLHQVGIAMQAYHAAHNTFPPGVVWAPSGEPLGFGRFPIGVIDRVARYGAEEPDTIYGNWLMMILPQLEESSLHARFDFGRPISDAVNAPGCATDLAVFKCPSDYRNGPDNQFQRGLAAGLSNLSYARGNYALNVGPDGNCAGLGTPDEPCVNGFFIRGTNLLKNNDQVWGSGVGGVNKSFNFRSVTDGLSKTVAVDEIRSGLDPLDPRGVWALGQVASSLIARHGKFGNTGGPNRCDPAGAEFVGCGKLTTKLGPDYLQANCMACTSGLLVEEANIQAAAASLHSGGLNSLMCDSSVQFIVDEVDVDVWQALHTRNGNESRD
jgi:apolipoprotein N-acyltransferase